MSETASLLPIGRFSTLSRLSVRMLRHYDAHGVLVPEYTDPASGYRWYTPAQLATAVDIRMLRDVGFGVAEIVGLLEMRGSDGWAAALRAQRSVLAKEVVATEGRIALISRMIEKRDDTMTITLHRQTTPAMTVAALRGTVPTYAHEAELWDRLMPLLAARGIAPTGPCGVIEHVDEFVEHDVDLSVFVPVSAGTPPFAGVDVIALPERECLVARVEGAYSQIEEAHDLLAARIAAEGLDVNAETSIAGRAFNLYLAGPGEVPEAEFLTEVHLPLAVVS